ncbi:MAG: hypothetical protein ACREPQ_02515 [Rhodanobacter sp.]
MPRRSPAIDDDTLRREVGHLADDVLLLPQQVTLLTGLSPGMLKERLRTRPPKPPHPEPREGERKALWYSLGSVRRYRAWLSEQAEVNAVIKRKRERQRTPGFSSWLATAGTDPWPIALLGPRRRPVDAWSTIRGEVEMGRGDRIQWMTRAEFVEAMGEWVGATRVALEQEVQANLAATRERELSARVTTSGQPKRRG